MAIPDLLPYLPLTLTLSALVLPILLYALEVSAEERRLVDRFRAGDEDAFKKLVQKYRAQLLSVARRYSNNDQDAEDALQNALIAAWQYRATFHGNAKFSTWMHRIIVNAAIKIKQKRSEDQLDTTLPEAGKRDEGISTLKDFLRENLSAEDQQILLLTSEGYSAPEISHILNLPSATVRQRLARIRQKLQKILGDHEGL
jgi:RNA polymerase sigma-70 factor (ECF subfamily)